MPPQSQQPDYVRDTIVAVATPAGKGGIGIVRVSGPDTERIAKAILSSVPAPRLATLSGFRNDDNDLIDEGLALYFKAPNSFTGEAVLELHAHGGPVVMSMLSDAIVTLGARRAEPGEFSKRAFLNGKLDLAQAEAIADLIDSATVQGAKAAQRSLSGVFSEAVSELIETLTRLRLHVEAAIDFPEDEIDFLSDRALAAKLEHCQKNFDQLYKDTHNGRLLRDGLVVAIAGKPNAGKSSLMNALCGNSRAIVTEIAGTTRDLLHEHIEIDGIAVQLIDTAGLRPDPDVIEAEGIRRARAAVANADLVLWVADVSDADASRYETGDLLGLRVDEELPVLTVDNKADLVNDDAPRVHADAVLVSAKTGAGMDELRRAILRRCNSQDTGEGTFTTRKRHLDALAEARTHFERGLSALEDAAAGEILAEELRLAQNGLMRITGEFTSDDLLGRIFAEFCIGK